MDIKPFSYTHYKYIKKFCLFILLLGVWEPTLAQSNCLPVKGKFISQILPVEDCHSPEKFCTRGQLTGHLHGDYDFIAQSFDSVSEASVPGAFFYTGYSFVHTGFGDLQLTDTGTLDLVNGRIATLLTITSGTEKYSMATGFLFVTGFSDPGQGTNSGWYEGEICGIKDY